MPFALLVIAVFCFALGASTRWWVAPNAAPWYPSFMCGGLFFWSLSTLWPMIASR